MSQKKNNLSDETSKPNPKKAGGNFLTRRRKNWTYLEVIGLALAFFLIIWPALTFVVNTVFPVASKAQAPNVQITKSANPAPGPVANGQTINYTVTIMTAAVSPTETTTVDLTDNFSAGLNCTSAVASPGGPANLGAGNATANWSSIASLSNVTLTLTLTCSVTAAAGATVTNNANVTVTNDSTLQTNQATSNTISHSVSGTVTTTVVTTTPPTTTVATTTAPTTTVATTTAPTTTVATTTAPTTTVATTTVATTTAPTTTVATTTVATTTAPTTTVGTTTVGTTTAPTTTVATTTPPTTTVATTTTVGTTLRPGTPTLGYPTSTPLAATPTNVPPTNTPGGPTPTAGPTTPTNTPDSSPAVPPTGATTTSSVPSGSGVVAGSITNSSGVPVGARVDLVYRKGGVDQVAASTVVDPSGQYFFGNVGPTGGGEFYFVRFSNPDLSGSTLRVFNSNPFSFAANAIVRLDPISVTGVKLNNATGGQQINLPFTFSWNSRFAGERYALSFFTSTGQQVLDSGDLGGATTFTLPAGKLANGQYTAQIRVTNGQGSGIAAQPFAFSLGSGPVAPIAQPPQQGSGATATTSRGGGNAPAAQPTPTPKPQNVPVAVGTPAGANPQNPSNQTAPSPTPTFPGGGGELIGGPQSLPGGDANVNPTPLIGSNPINDTGGKLPSSGGELPFAGLMLAGLTLIGRRIRLYWQGRVQS